LGVPVIKAPDIRGFFLPGLVWSGNFGYERNNTIQFFFLKGAWPVHSEFFLLLTLGFMVGILGTLIGAGGGFIMVPVLLILYPSLNPETLTGISLAVVCCNAISGSVAYAFKGRIDYRSAIIFSLAAAPGSILGAYATSLIPRHSFEFGFGIVMIVIAIYLFFGGNAIKNTDQTKIKHPVRILIDRKGHEHLISYNAKLGILLSTVVGFISSLLGIGGGIIHVPALVRLLGFPVHIATATSHAILAVMAFLGVMAHLMRGDLNSVASQILILASAVMVGAQLGAHLSDKVHGSWIIRALAIALLSVGVRFLVT